MGPKERSPDLLDRALAVVRRHRMVKRGDAVLVGLSGGPDSVTLLDLLCRLKGELGIAIEAAHLNHMLRGQDAEADEAWARSFAAMLGVRFHEARVDVAQLAGRHGLSVEAAGRLARYSFFEDVCRSQGLDKIALGHNRDDSVETVVMMFLKGSGISGLGGIPPVRDGRVIRPLIEFSRHEIERYCLFRGLTPRTDSSNYDPRYFRNRVRHEVIPFLEKASPGFRRAVERLSMLCRADAALLDELAERAASRMLRGSGDCLEVDASSILRAPRALATRILRLCHLRCAAKTAPLGYGHVMSLLKLARARKSGKGIHLPGAVVAEIERGRLRMYRRDTSKPSITSHFDHVVTLEVPGFTWTPRFELGFECSLQEADDGAWMRTSDKRLARLDADTLRMPLRVRPRLPGDRFSPLGLGGTKKLKDFLISRKVPRRERDDIPLVVDSSGAIAWVVGHEISEGNKVTPRTKTVLQVMVVQNPALQGRS